MSGTVRYAKEDVQNRIARDYVMGSLCAQARRRCETLRKQLPELDTKIYAWSEKLQPMADDVPELAPSASVWSNLESSITASNVRGAEKTVRDPLWSRLGFLRALAAGFSFIAIGLAVLLAMQPGTGQLDYVAVLATAEGDKSFVATAVEQSKQLTLKRFGEAPASGNQYQLWALSKTDGEARSLGLIADANESVRTLSESDWRLVIDAHELLITEEPLGGSPLGEPGEKIVSRGLCIRLSTG